MKYLTPMRYAIVSLAAVSLLQACGVQETSHTSLSADGSPLQPEVEAPLPPQIPRFMSWLDLIEPEFVGTPSEVADGLVEHKARAIAFNIQALGRLYKDQDPLFRTLHKQFQKLEDAIGEYQKWRDLVENGKQANVSAAVMAKLINNRENGRRDLEKSLVETRFLPAEGVSYIQELRGQLLAYKWKDAVTDRREMLQKLIEELDEVKTTKYDFSRLEEGNGVHEFRRKMRWFSMEARGLNGMVTLKGRESSCPIPAYADIVTKPIANTKYAVLPGASSEPNPITLSPCLYVKVAQLIEEVNWIKAKVELEDSLSEAPPTDRVSPEDQAKLEGMLSEIMSYDLFGLLQAELKMD